MIRPRPARWFEVLCARQDATLALEALARTGAVELEPKTGSPTPLASRELAALLGRFAELAQRFRAYWPDQALTPSAFPQPPAAALRHAIATIGDWAAEAEPAIASLQALDGERRDLEHWRAVLQEAPAALLRDAARAGPVLAVRLMAVPAGVEPALPRQALAHAFQVAGQAHLLVVVPGEQVHEVEEQASAAKALVFRVPRELDVEAEGAHAAVSARLGEVERKRSQALDRLAALADRWNLRRVLGDAARIQWVIQHVRALDSGPLFAWICGWTSDLRGVELTRALDRSWARALLHFPPAPAGRRPPLLLDNPRWVKPFEVFTRALGMPAGDEADPSMMVALIVPLLFGYMFGDVGQGLVIAAIGWWAKRKMPVLKLLVAGGLASAAFGVVFGSVFGLHGIVSPLWIDPLADPIRVLAVPLYVGAALVMAGYLLQGIEAGWGGRLREWLACDAGQPLVYAGIVGAFVLPQAAWLAAAGASLAIAGAAIHRKSWRAAAGALGALVERTMQALVNTLSFARVGAFALAHAGLSSAISVLASASGSAPLEVLIVVLGNIVVIALEALVVSIQTTRLVLFEFFTRFLKAEGRAFRSLPLPPVTANEI